MLTLAQYKDEHQGSFQTCSWYVAECSCLPSSRVPTPTSDPPIYLLWVIMSLTHHVIFRYTFVAGSEFGFLISNVHCHDSQRACCVTNNPSHNASAYASLNKSTPMCFSSCFKSTLQLQDRISIQPCLDTYRQ